MLRPSVGGIPRSGYLPLACLVAGTALGGSLLGLAIVGIHFVLAASEAARAGVLLGVGGLSSVAILSRGIRRWVPERRCQVSRHLLLTSTRERAALQWGLRLGLGVCTLTVTPAIYVLLAAAASQHRAIVGFLMCSTYGVTRGAAIFVGAVSKDRSERRGDGEARGGQLKAALHRPLAVVAWATVILVSMTIPG